MVVMYTFFSDGFFGYGEPGNFKYFSLAHIIPIVLLIVAIFVTYKYKEKLRNWKYEQRFRYILSFIILFFEMAYYWRILYVGDEQGLNSLISKLPLQLCTWGAICSIYMLITKNKLLFSYNFFVTIIYSSAALLFPSVISKCGPTYFRYYQFFCEHALPIYATFYMMFVHSLKTDYKYIYIVIGIMLVHAFVAIKVNNAFPGTNFLYLQDASVQSFQGDNPINYLPKNQYLRALCLTGITLMLFNIEYFIYYKINNKKKS